MKKNYLYVAALTLLISGCGSMEMSPEERQQKFPPVTETTKETEQEAEKETVSPVVEEVEEQKSQEKEETPPEQVPAEETSKEETVEEKGAEEQDNSENQGPVKNTMPEIVNQFSNQAEYNPDINIDELSNEPQSWGFKRNKEHTPVKAYYTADLPKYGTYYLGNTEEKVVYLTFDEGYENGFTPAILDTLKEKQVKAAFFITGSYLKHNPDLVKRMRAEGHLVANHSQTHPDFTTKTDEEVIAEVSQVGDKFKELTGTEMDPFFRFPSGRYSERDLYIVRKLGYRNIFWSMAHKDWEVNNQPGKEVAYQHVMDNYHPGAIILLHAVSSSNTEALADIITGLDDAGYRFGSLYELE